MSGVGTKAAIVYKTFPNEAAARAEGFTIQGVATRGGQKWGRVMVIQKKVKTGKAQFDDLASLLEGMGMGEHIAFQAAEKVVNNPSVVAPAFSAPPPVFSAPTSSSPFLSPSIFSKPAAPAEAPLEVDLDELIGQMGSMGFKGGKRSKNKKEKKSRKQRKAKRKMTKRK
jgi:hypothetical protein